MTMDRDKPHTQQQNVMQGRGSAGRKRSRRISPGKVTRTSKMTVRPRQSGAGAASSEVPIEDVAKTGRAGDLIPPPNDGESDVSAVKTRASGASAPSPLSPLAAPSGRAPDGLGGMGHDDGELVEDWTRVIFAPYQHSTPELVQRTRARRGARTERASGDADDGRHSETPAGPMPLPGDVRGRMENAFGVGFRDVEVHPNSDRAGGSTHAVTAGNAVHFAPGKFQPGTQDGDWLIGHELAHVVQQRGGPPSGPPSGQAFGEGDAGRRVAQGMGERQGDVRGQLEAEADRAADAAVSGQKASVQLKATPGMAQTFREGEDHTPGPGDADGIDAATNADDADGADVSGAADTDIDLDAELKTIAAEGADAVEPAAGGGAGGGGPAAEPAGDAPAVSGCKPEQALDQLAGVRPDKLAAAVGGVRAAATADVSGVRTALAQDPPKMASDGEEVGNAANANAEGGAAATGDDGADTSAAAESAPVSAALAGDPASANDVDSAQTQPEGVSEAAVASMSRGIDSAATASAQSTTGGPPRKVSLTGNADPVQAIARRDEVAGSVEQAGAEARRNIAEPMGENHIDVTVPTEILQAPVTGMGTQAAPAGPKLNGDLKVDLSERGEAIGIIARKEKGAEIAAAMSQAKADMAAKRQEHAEDEAQRRDEAKQEIAGLKAEARTEQDKARNDAQSQVDEARGQWQAEVDAKSIDARKQADAELQAGMDTVKAEQKQADSEAERHIADGEQKAKAEQQKAETEVNQHKQKAEEEKSSGGIWGWVKSKAKAFFDGIKQAISAAIDMARKAVKMAIDAATKLATAVIEKARQAIVATIDGIGKALMAISDVLLVAFPELRAKFRAKIEGVVNRAKQAVNKWAEKLQAGVSKALELLGKGLDAALGLLEKGLHAIVNGVATVVNGALNAAEAIAATLGGFLSLVKDVASAPGQWLSNLGAAVIDGIKNHLWQAFQTSVSEWFKSKVVEVLGIGGMVMQILLQGGIDLAKIGKMAWNALKAAIPAALIAILVEKLVSMIVPAPGAVMVIIEGLQAAWGTIQRIVAAIGAFIAFLKAVKGGSAGPQFAQMLALAAVVVLDFVSNWLLKKLRRAAAKVGAKLRSLADKLKQRRKKEGRDRDRREHDGKKNDEQNETRAQKQARLDRAVDEVKLYTEKPRFGPRLSMKLRQIRRKHRLTTLSAKYDKKRAIYRISAAVNPSTVFEVDESAEGVAGKMRDKLRGTTKSNRDDMWAAATQVLPQGWRLAPPVLANPDEQLQHWELYIIDPDGKREKVGEVKNKTNGGDTVKKTGPKVEEDAAHNKKIYDLIEQYCTKPKAGSGRDPDDYWFLESGGKSSGHQLGSTEALLDIPDYAGKGKDVRRPDLVLIHAKTGEKKYINVGLAMQSNRGAHKKGDPIAREREAQRDIEKYIKRKKGANMAKFEFVAYTL